MVSARPVSLDGITRLVVLAARAGDETAGADGLIATATRLGLQVDIVGATDTAEGHGAEVPEGGLAARQDKLTARVVALVGDGRGTVIVAPWREDGDPDHEAVGRSASAAAARTGADLWEYPLRSSRRPEDWGDPAQEPEHFLQTPTGECVDDSLDRLHTEHADPWGVESRWFERRKRDLVLAMLPRPSFERTLEVGSSTGALAEALASRSGHVLAVDSSAAAVAAATRRFRDDERVTVERLDVPQQWPQDQTFDLVVLSEVGYFMSPAGLETLVERIGATLAPDGVVVLCHWRHPIEGWVLDAEAVHAGFEASDLPAPRATYRDEDVEIRVHVDQWLEADQ